MPDITSQDWTSSDPGSEQAAGTDAAIETTSVPPSPPATYEGLLGADGRFTQGWADKLPQNAAAYRGIAASAQDLPSLLKMVHDNQVAARAKLSMPHEKSTPDQIANWRKVVGAPDTAEGYGELRPENMPAEMWDAEGEKKFAELAHKHHLSTAAVKDIMTRYGGMIEEAEGKIDAYVNTSLAAEDATLKQAWGEKYHDNLRAAQRFAATIGLKADNPIFTRAEVVMAMAQGTKLISEDRLVSGGNSSLSASPRDRATAIMTDPRDPLYSKYQSGDAETQSLVSNLLKNY